MKTMWTLALLLAGGLMLAGAGTSAVEASSLIADEQTITCQNIGDCEANQERKRDRKKDGSCEMADQTRQRKRVKDGSCQN